MTLIRLLVLCQLTGIAFAQIMSGSVTIDGVSFTYETRLEPPSPGISSTGGGTLTEKRVVKRHICDFVQKTYYGYDLTMDTLADGRYRLTFSPLTITPAKMEEIFNKVKGWRPVALPQQPASQIIRAGDTLAIDLFVNPATGQKIVDYIKVHVGHGRGVTASGPPRDFTLEDADFLLSAPRLSINGKLLEESVQFKGSISGTPLWIYVGGHGRFIFSLTPRPELGMRKGGQVRGHSMSWRCDSDDFLITTDQRIAPGDGVYHLYVFQDPSFRPRGPEGFRMGAGGRLESLIRR